MDGSFFFLSSFFFINPSYTYCLFPCPKYELYLIFSTEGKACMNYILEYGARLCMFPFIFSVAVQLYIYIYIYIKNITRSIGAFLVADFCFLAYLNKARKQKFGVFEFRAMRAARFHLWFPVKGLSYTVFFSS
jgi:hypothetical protein